MEAKKKALRVETLEGSFVDSSLQEKLAELEATKGRPYGAINAVSICIHSYILQYIFLCTYIHITCIKLSLCIDYCTLHPEPFSNINGP